MHFTRLLPELPTGADWPADFIGPAAHGVLAAMRVHRDSAQVLEHGCTVLSLLTTTVPGREAMADAGVREFCCSVLSRTPSGPAAAHIAACCLHTLSLLSFPLDVPPWARLSNTAFQLGSSARLHAEAEAMLGCGAVELALDRLRSCSNASAPGSSIIMMLASLSALPGAHARFAAAAAADVLLSFVRSAVAAAGESDARVASLAAAIFALHNLAAAHEATAGRLVAAGAVNTIAELMLLNESCKDAAEDLAHAGCCAFTALLRLHRSDSDGLVQQCLDAGAAARIVAALTRFSDNPRIADAAAEAMLLLLLPADEESGHGFRGADSTPAAAAAAAGPEAGGPAGSEVGSAAAAGAGGPAIAPAPPDAIRSADERHRRLVEAGAMQAAVDALEAIKTEAEAAAAGDGAAGAAAEDTRTDAYSDAVSVARAVLRLAQLLELLCFNSRVHELLDAAVSAGVVSALVNALDICMLNEAAVAAVLQLLCRIISGGSEITGSRTAAASAEMAVAGAGDSSSKLGDIDALLAASFKAAGQLQYFPILASQVASALQCHPGNSRICAAACRLMCDLRSVDVQGSWLASDPALHTALARSLQLAAEAAQHAAEACASGVGMMTAESGADRARDHDAALPSRAAESALQLMLLLHSDAERLHLPFPAAVVSQWVDSAVVVLTRSNATAALLEGALSLVRSMCSVPALPSGQFIRSRSIMQALLSALQLKQLQGARGAKACELALELLLAQLSQAPRIFCSVDSDATGARRLTQLAASAVTALEAQSHAVGTVRAACAVLLQLHRVARPVSVASAADAAALVDAIASCEPESVAGTAAGSRSCSLSFELDATRALSAVLATWPALHPDCRADPAAGTAVTVPIAAAATEAPLAAAAATQAADPELQRARRAAYSAIACIADSCVVGPATATVLDSLLQRAGGLLLAQANAQVQPLPNSHLASSSAAESDDSAGSDTSTTVVTVCLSASALCSALRSISAHSCVRPLLAAGGAATAVLGGVAARGMRAEAGGSCAAEGIIVAGIAEPPAADAATLHSSAATVPSGSRDPELLPVLQLQQAAAPAACGVIRNLCASPELRFAVASCGGRGTVAQALLTMLQHHSTDSAVVWAACGALFGLVCEPANCAALLDAGTMEVLASALSEEVLADARIAWAACGTVLKLALALVAPAAPTSAGAVAPASGSDVVAAATQAAPPAASRFEHLAAAIQDGAVKLLAAAHRLHCGDVRVKKAVRAAAADLSTCPAAAAALRMHGL